MDVPHPSPAEDPAEHWRTLADSLGVQLSQAHEDVRRARAHATEMAQTATQAKQELAEAKHKHAADIRWIGEAALEAAGDVDDDGWCETFDDVITSLNQKLHLKLPERPKRWSVTVEVQLYVDGISSEEAKRQARQHIYDALTMAECQLSNVDVTDVEKQ